LLHLPFLNPNILPFSIFLFHQTEHKLIKNTEKRKKERIKMQKLIIVAALAVLAACSGVEGAKPTPKPVAKGKCVASDIIGKWALITDAMELERKKKNGKWKNVWVQEAGILSMEFMKDGTIDATFMGMDDGVWETEDLSGNWSLALNPDFHGSCLINYTLWEDDEETDSYMYMARLIGVDADKFIAAAEGDDDFADIQVAFKGPDSCDNSTIMGSFAYPSLVNMAKKGYVSSLLLEYWDGKGMIENVGSYSVDEDCVVTIPGSNYAAVAHSSGIVYTSMSGPLDIDVAEFLHMDN